ncbi:MAG TPA: hypothetical protein VK139_06540 [Microbacteriaceae bacterium]|nr:hypothetical protein [Microbacteriaceae bacterium]
MISARLRGKIAALGMAVLLSLYLVASIVLAIGFLSSGQAAGVVMGVALMALPLLGFWALARELQFGWRSERLIAALEAEGRLLELDADSGPDLRSRADAAFPALQEAVVEQPEDWRAWLRLALGYDAAGDRRRARMATRRAIELSRGI